MKRIEMLADVRDGHDAYYRGEERVVTPGKAGYFCGLGWARDLSGEIETGAADTADKVLDVQSVRHVTTATNVGS